jgi:hypothetical protein
MLFWLGTAMAPTVESGSFTDDPEPVIGDVTGMTGPPASGGSEAARPLLPWPASYCLAGCPDPPEEPSVDTEAWKPAVPDARPGAEPQAAIRRPQIAPPPAPRAVEEWRALVAAYFAPGDVDRALTVIACESGGDPNAQNPRSGAAGLFQHIPRYWESRAAAVGLPGASIFDPVANVAAAAYLVYADGGWRHWDASAACW